MLMTMNQFFEEGHMWVEPGHWDTHRGFWVHINLE